MQKRTTPYIWITWLIKFMSGENQCFYSSWFKSHFQYDKIPSDFDVATWTAKHNKLLLSRKDYYERLGYEVFLEDQNSFRLSGANGTIVSGKPDLVAIKEGEKAIVEDVKTGQESNSHLMQVLNYMLILPLSVKHCSGLKMFGVIKYKEHEVGIDSSKIDNELRNIFKDTISIVGGESEPEKVPSFWECKWCDIPKKYCDKRMDGKQEIITDHNLF